MERAAPIIAGLAARRLASWLLLFALLLRGLVPTGYMPNMDPANGKGLLVICTANGSATISTGDGPDDGTAPADTIHQGLCPFHALSALAPVLLLVILLLPSRPAIRIGLSQPRLDGRRVVSGAPLGARAPPALVA